ncbi:hypothetical protein [Kordiimonas marina]|uniref:hypothetical protein n=1 Tax=Kordiimonas marina TaxID=2872312 RepID=UPI001FF2E63B|nr:hypothetical protein [Kordiimonas marina]MCJ9428705.1 hypothetical protein [Kordiimonas marina]
MDIIDQLNAQPRPYTLTSIPEAQSFARAEIDRIRRTAPILDNDARALMNAIEAFAKEGLKVALKDVGADTVGHITCSLEIMNSDVNQDGQLFYPAEAYVRSVLGKTAYWRSAGGGGLTFTTIRVIERLSGAGKPSDTFFSMYQLSSGPFEYKIALPLFAAMEEMSLSSSRKRTDDQLTLLAEKLVPGLSKRMEARQLVEVHTKVTKILADWLEYMQRNDAYFASADFLFSGAEIIEKRAKMIEEFLVQLIQRVKDERLSWKKAIQETQVMANQFMGKTGSSKQDTRSLITRKFKDNTQRLIDELNKSKEEFKNYLIHSEQLSPGKPTNPEKSARYKRIWQAKLKKAVPQIFENTFKDLMGVTAGVQKYLRWLGPAAKGLQYLAWVSDIAEIISQENWVEKTKVAIKVALESLAAGVFRAITTVAISALAETVISSILLVSGIGAVLALGAVATYFVIKIIDEHSDKIVTRAAERLVDAVNQLWENAKTNYAKLRSYTSGDAINDMLVLSGARKTRDPWIDFILGRKSFPPTATDNGT